MTAVAIVLLVVGAVGMLYALLIVTFSLLEWFIFWRPQYRKNRSKK